MIKLFKKEEGKYTADVAVPTITIRKNLKDKSSGIMVYLTIAAILLFGIKLPGRIVIAQDEFDDFVIGGVPEDVIGYEEVSMPVAARKNSGPNWATLSYSGFRGVFEAIVKKYELKDNTTYRFELEKQPAVYSEDGHNIPFFKFGAPVQISDDEAAKETTLPRSEG